MLLCYLRRLGPVMKILGFLLRRYNVAGTTKNVFIIGFLFSRCDSCWVSIWKYERGGFLDNFLMMLAVKLWSGSRLSFELQNCCQRTIYRFWEQSFRPTKLPVFEMFLQAFVVGPTGVGDNGGVDTQSLQKLFFNPTGQDLSCFH